MRVLISFLQYIDLYEKDMDLLPSPACLQGVDVGVSSVLVPGRQANFLYQARRRGAILPVISKWHYHFRNEKKYT